MADYFKQRTASLCDLSKEFCNWMAQLTSCVNLHETTGGGGGEVNNWLTIVKKKKRTRHNKWFSVRILRKLPLAFEGSTFNNLSPYHFCYFYSKHRRVAQTVDRRFNCNLLYGFMRLTLIQLEGYTKSVVQILG